MPGFLYGRPFLWCLFTGPTGAALRDDDEMGTNIASTARGIPLLVVWGEEPAPAGYGTTHGYSLKNPRQLLSILGNVVQGPRMILHDFEAHQ